MRLPAIRAAVLIHRKYPFPDMAPALGPMNSHAEVSGTAIPGPPKLRSSITETADFVKQRGQVHKQAISGERIAYADLSRHKRGIIAQSNP